MRSGAVKNWFGSGNRAAALLWLLTVLVAAIGGVAGHRTVTDVYHGAVEHWLSGQDLYGGGFQYPPTFVLLFAPFHALPHAFGEYLWRGLSALLLAIGCWRLLGLQVTTPARRRRLFLWLSLPVLLTAFDAFRNGQANVLFGALTVLGACALAGRSGAAPRLWIARRSLRKPIDPGLYDNVVGGGIGWGYGIGETLVKECQEESGIPAALAGQARAGRSVQVLAQHADGVQWERIYVYDLPLPEDFIPSSQDGEVSEHRLVSIDEVQELIAAGAMTVDASLATLDWLLRGGHVDSDSARFSGFEQLPASESSPLLS